MLSFVKTCFVSGLAFGLASNLNLPAALALPQANENGDYGILDRAVHRWWQVVDPDPAGLNCRLDARYGYDSISRPGNIYNFPIVGTLESGSTFESGPANAGGIFYDDRGLTWLYVRSSSVGNAQECFVRANSAYVRPIP